VSTEQNYTKAYETCLTLLFYVLCVLNCSMWTAKKYKNIALRKETGPPPVVMAITTKFGLLTDIDLLKWGTSANPKPEVKLRLSVRHLENRYNIIILPKMVWFGWNSTAWCRMTSPIQWYGRNRNRK